MLVRFDPFREFDRMTQDMFSSPRFAPAALPFDAYRRKDEFVVHFDLPGVSPESIDVTVEKNTLTVEATREWQPHEDDHVVAAGRWHGRFSRQLALGEGLDAEGVHADYDNGVLTVTIPVAEQAKPRKISVGAPELNQAG